MEETTKSETEFYTNYCDVTKRGGSNASIFNEQYKTNISKCRFIILTASHLQLYNI